MSINKFGPYQKENVDHTLKDYNWVRLIWFGSPLKIRMEGIPTNLRLWLEITILQAST